ncbi:MAG: carbohydrate kinase [Bacteroidales bacterium]|nr:carbohydrate kinase [Candidatus Sodaliphilus limicaballi]
MENYIVGLGEILFDYLPEGKKLGGAPANFAYHASQFGLNGIAVSAIGNDENGNEIKEILKKQGANNHLEVVEYPTGTVQVTLSGNGIPQYDICLGVAYDNIPWTPAIEEIARNSRAVCFGSLAQRTAVTRETVQKFLDTMPALGTLKVFDINLRQQWYSKEIIEESLNRCNVLKLNDEEISTVAKLLGLGDVAVPTDDQPLQLVDVEDQCRAIMRNYDLQMVILTCGINGSFVFHADGVSFQDTPHVEVADTVGAGDSFTGSFVACVLKGKPIAEAHKTAVLVSAYVCSQNGAMPEIPTELTK